MSIAHRRAGVLSTGLAALATAAAMTLAVLAVSPQPALANTVTIHDASHVLDATRVQNEAATLPDPVDVYTTTKFADDNAAFDQETQSKVTSSSLIVRPPPRRGYPISGVGHGSSPLHAAA